MSASATQGGYKEERRKIEETTGQKNIMACPYFPYAAIIKYLV